MSYIFVGSFHRFKKFLKPPAGMALGIHILRDILKQAIKVGYLEKDTFQETFSLSLEGIFLKRDVLKVISKKTFVKKAL